MTNEFSEFIQKEKSPTKQKVQGRDKWAQSGLIVTSHTGHITKAIWVLIHRVLFVYLLVCLLVRMASLEVFNYSVLINAKIHSENYLIQKQARTRAVDHFLFVFILVDFHLGN